MTRVPSLLPVMTFMSISFWALVRFPFRSLQFAVRLPVHLLSTALTICLTVGADVPKKAAALEDAGDFRTGAVQRSSFFWTWPPVLPS